MKKHPFLAGILSLNGAIDRQAEIRNRLEIHK